MAAPTKRARRNVSRVDTQEFTEFYADSDSEVDPYDSDDDEDYELPRVRPNNSDSDSDEGEIDHNIIGAGDENNVVDNGVVGADDGNEAVDNGVGAGDDNEADNNGVGAVGDGNEAGGNGGGAVGDGPVGGDMPGEAYTNNIQWVERDSPSVKLPYQGPGNNADLILQTDKVNAQSKPKEFFDLFFTQEVLQLVADETLRYAQQAGDTEFKTTVHEISIYWGLCMVMGVIRKPSIFMYWSTAIYSSTPIFGKVMTRKRFQVLSRYIHFADNQANTPDDKLSKIRKYYDLITQSFHEIAMPGETISLDEALIRFFGRISFKTYNASKPAKYGMKAYKVCNVLGYTFKFDLYTGKAAQNLDNLKGVTKIVFDLLEGYLDNGRKVYMDNWYNSPELFLRLLERQTQAAGTVRLNRKGMPKELNQKTKSKKGGSTLYTEHL